MTYPYALITENNLAGYQQLCYGTSRKPKDSIINYANNVVEAFSKIYKYLFVTMYSHQPGLNLADKVTLYLLVKRVSNHWIRSWSGQNIRGIVFFLRLTPSLASIPQIRKAPWPKTGEVWEIWPQGSFKGIGDKRCCSNVVSTIECNLSVGRSLAPFIYQ